MKTLYLALTIIGFITAAYFTVAFFINSEMGMVDALAKIPSNDMGKLLVSDFTIAVIVVWIFIYNESKRLDMKFWWAYMILTVGVGVCFSLPLFLYIRQKQIEAAQ